MAENPVPAAVPTWSQLHKRGIARLQEAANRHLNPETASRRILVEVSGFEASELLSSWHEPAPEGAAARYEQMLQQLLAGEPLQYVLGSWGFRCLDLFLDNRVLIPRPETEIVVEVALKELAARSLSKQSASQEQVITQASATPRLLAADLGCGSGAVGLSLAAECPNADVVCTDISADALAVTRANLAGIGTAGMRVRLAQGSWYEALGGDSLKGALDLIVSNPPYIATHEPLPEVVAAHEPATALYAGPVGTEAIDALLSGAPHWLAPSGSIVCEIAPHQAAPATYAAQANGLTNIKILPDLTGTPRVLRAQSPPVAPAPAASHPTRYLALSSQMLHQDSYPS